MVEQSQSQQDGDGIERTVHYATFRRDKAPTPGYSAELISDKITDPNHFDDLDSVALPQQSPELDTFLKLFKRNVAQRPHEPFLGTRQKLSATEYGEYEWQTWSQVDTIVQKFAKGLTTLDLCPQIEGEDKLWRFLGVWSKNRYEWTASLLAAMHYKITTVGFYDAMSAEQVDFILNQTEMTTVVCSEDYARKLIQMKKSDNQAVMVTHLVVIDAINEALVQAAQEAQIELHSFQTVCEAGEAAGSAPPFEESSKHDVYIFSYTSGTTGDSKGVKLSHNNMLSNLRCMLPRVPMIPGEAYISYLPYTHGYEQALLGQALVVQLRIGYSSGDPTRLAQDCSVLKPHFFPSVPRLYNKIYSTLKTTFDATTGCKRWLVDKAIAAKQANQQATGSITHCCWDALVFKKAKGILGGQVRTMVSASAPIDKDVLDFLKICFCCPIIEAYGLTESSGGSCVTAVSDRLAGHVGGPVESVKLRLKDLPEMNYLSTDKPYPRGEICLYGPSIFSGYYKRPDKTSECFDKEGWFQTGDVGLIYPNGSVKIIDRSKHIFKLSQGEYIAPEKIEQVMTLSQMIAQCFLYGDSLKNATVCVVVPEEAWVKNWAQSNGLSGQSFQELCQNAELKRVVGEDMTRLAVEKKLSSLERPKEFVLWHELCSIENNLLTSTFKMKRNVAKDLFKPQIDAMYERVAELEAATSQAKAAFK